MLILDSTDDSVNTVGWSSRRGEDMTKSSVSCSSAIGTLVERTTRFTMVGLGPRMDGSDSLPTGQELATVGRRSRRSRPRRDRRHDHDAAGDRGSEMGPHARMSIDTGLAVYFCDPHSPWKRWTNESTVSVWGDPAPQGLAG